MSTDIDLVYDHIDKYLSNGDFYLIDFILDAIRLYGDLRDICIDVLLAYLTATLPAKSKLSSRSKFFEDVKQVLIEREEYDNKILAGLE